MRWNSAAGILMVALYSVSGMPRCSESMFMSFISKSEIFVWSADSNMKLMFSPSSSALMVMTSSLPAHLRIFASETKLMPSETLRSQR